MFSDVSDFFSPVGQIKERQLFCDLLKGLWFAEEKTRARPSLISYYNHPSMKYSVSSGRLFSTVYWGFPFQHQF